MPPSKMMRTSNGSILALFLLAMFPITCHAWNSRRYYYEERFCLNEQGGFMGTPPETVKNYMACPSYCHKCVFMHPQNSIWCVQQHIGEPKDVYTESYQDDRLVAFENDSVANVSCIKRQEEFTNLLQNLTGTDASCNMVHKSGVGHAYFYVCWTGAFSNRRRQLRESTLDHKQHATTDERGQPIDGNHHANQTVQRPMRTDSSSLFWTQNQTNTSMAMFRNPSNDPWRTYNWTPAVV